MTFYVFKASRHSDDDQIKEGNVLKIGSRDHEFTRMDEVATIFEPP